MVGVLESLLIGAGVGSMCGTCIGVCVIIRWHRIDSQRHTIDVENMTKNVLHTLDEEPGAKVDYLTARPIV